MRVFLGSSYPYQQTNCHPDRSAAKWRDLLFSQPASDPNGTQACPLSSREPVTFSVLSRFLYPTRCFSNRHPERSASQIYRITEGLRRAVEGPRRCLLADALRSFPAKDYKET